MSPLAKNWNGSLEAAMTLLVQNQAAFVGHMRESQQQFARINRELEEIKRILIRHEHALADLPEAIRQKVGFRQRT